MAGIEGGRGNTEFRRTDDHKPRYKVFKIIALFRIMPRNMKLDLYGVFLWHLTF